MNELRDEKSPYLQQHAKNPVHWKAWNDRSFALARTLDRPIFLSIGYSTCHWCHVMEHECFENVDIAKILNDNFVSIKVDREELPEVDSIYMEALQMMTRRGGWPLNIFLDHDLRPFFGGTYFPAKTFSQTLGSLFQLWTQKRDEIFAVSKNLTQHLQNTSALQAATQSAEELKKNYLHAVEQQFDSLHGGHKGAPKFPNNWEAQTLFRLYTTPEAHTIARTTLEKMLSGGIWDHVGGGLHRYSTDEEWRVPHFEKMLYDQASLLSAIAEALAQGPNPFLQKRAEELIAYLNRDLRIPNGAFYAAEDADSEGHEGTFYVWNYSDLQKNLSATELKILGDHFEASPSGNWEENNIFHNTNSFAYSEVDNIWKKLLTIRSQRVRPLRDEKVIASWNGLMIAALARYARVTGNLQALTMAEEATQFIRENLYSDGVLKRRWIAGEAKFEATLDDHAFMIEALLELHTTTASMDYLNFAIELEKKVSDLFWDAQKQQYQSNSRLEKNLIRNNQEYTDNVIPSSVTCILHNFIALSDLTLDESYLEKVRQSLSQAPQGLASFVQAYPRYVELLALLNTERETLLIVLDPNATSLNANNLRPTQLRYFSTLARPQSYFRRTLVAVPNSSHPLLRDKKIIFKPATFYLCQGKTCSAPSEKRP